MVTAKDIYSLLDEKFSFETQESWDNSGLLIDSLCETDSVLVTLDVTKEAVEKANEIGAKIIVSHHPVIFTPLKKIDKSSIVYSLIKNDISVISAHTNFDKYKYGTSYMIAQTFGLDVMENESYEIGITASLKATTTEELAEIGKTFFDNISCSLPEKQIEKVFICAGSGSGMKEEVINSKADCFITGECKYHDVLDLAQIGISTITLTHDGSEVISLSTLADIIKNRFKDINIEVFEANSLQYTI